MKILVIDNYDSFTFNLVKLIRDLGYARSTEVFRNDRISLEEIDRFDKILISPGPGLPDEAGITKQMIKAFAPSKDILGICLGHQGIAEIYGAQLYNLDEVLHGVSTKTRVLDREEKLFAGLPDEFTAGHYHSWSVKPESINGNLIVTATNEAGLIMGIKHSKYSVRGLQFHPESVMTEYGHEVMKNWLKN